MSGARKRVLSCGIVVGNGDSVLLGHATRSKYWDIPKGLADRGETPRAAAIRELEEETGLVTTRDTLVELEQHRYLPHKDLILFGWYLSKLPDPALLVCRSTVAIGTALLPEFDRFGVFTWDEGMARVGKNLRRILDRVADVGFPGRLAQTQSQ